MNQPLNNSDSQQLDANSKQHADNPTSQNVVQGNQNRVVQGNENQSVLGDNNTVVQGNNNLMFVIKELILGQQLAPVGNPARPENQRLLLADVKQEVSARLKQSLHNAVLINLGKEAQPQQVKRPWDADIKIGLKPAIPLPDSTTILEVFDSEEIVGKLLILGAPGSGKTTTQLELAQELIKRAEEQPDYPVPVLFNLSSWKDDRQSLADWLVVELKSKYGVSKKLGQEWVNNRQLLPLLDGLDELESQRQELCVQLINQFLASEIRPLHVVVCSRIEEYSSYTSNLHLSGAISLRELNEIQILRYFEAAGRVDFLQTLQQDEALFKLMRTPLFLSITVLSVQELSIEDLQRLETMEARIEHLFDAYWQQQMFNRKPSKELYVLINRPRLLLDKYIRRLPVEPGIEPYTQHKPPTPKQTKQWLIWLAQQMQKESKTEFLIEEIQPSYLKTIRQKIIYVTLITLVITILFLNSPNLYMLVIIGLILKKMNLEARYNLFFNKINKYNFILFVVYTLIIWVFYNIFFWLFYWLDAQCFICKILYLLLLIKTGLSIWLFYKKMNTNKIIHIHWGKSEQGMIIGAAFGIIYGINQALSIGEWDLIRPLNLALYTGLSQALYAGFVWWLLYSVLIFEDINLTDTITFRWKNINKSLNLGLYSGIFFILTKAFFYLVNDILSGKSLQGMYINTIFEKNIFIIYDFFNFLLSIAFNGLNFGLMAGLIFMVISGLNNSNIEERNIPNQGIWKCTINSIFFGIGIGIFLIIIISQYLGITGIINDKSGSYLLINWLVIFLFNCILFSGGMSSIQHLTLRLILYFNGYIPWNYARFLNYCTERLFLQRVGGRYRFIHKMLQDHFAQMEFRRD